MALEIGQILNNRYRIEQMVGKGGMGAVYRAYHTTRQMHVAIKENSFTSPEAIKQFECEAKLLTQVNHPNLPQVFEYFSLPNGKQYLVMVFIEGETLHDKLYQEGVFEPLSTPYVLGWVLQLCDALNHLHHLSPPIIHRDIKPLNIKLNKADGRVILVDFGIAKAFEMNVDTDAGAKRKTPGYCPPEQYDSHTDVRSDIYALGATLYHLLTRHVPASSIDRLIGNSNWHEPRYWNKDLTPEIEQIILKAIALQPQTRYQNIQELQKELEPYAAILQEHSIEIKKELTADEYNQRGLTYLNLGLFEEALSDFSQAIRLKPDDGSTYNNRGIAYTGLSMYPKALSDYTKAIQLSIEESQPTIYLNRATIYDRNQQYKKALNDYAIAIQMDPFLAEVYNNRGITYEKIQEYEKALEDYSKAIQLECNLAQNYYNRGVMYERLEQYKMALDDYDKAEQLDPNDPEVYFSQGVSYFKLGEYQKAIESYNQSILLDPNNSQTFINRGQAYCSLNNYKEGLSDFSQALNLDPQNQLAQNNVDLVYKVLINAYTKAIIEKPEDSQHYYERGCIYLELNQDKKSLKDLTQAIQLDPNRIQFYQARAALYTKSHHYYKKALADYNKIIQLDPNWAPAYNNRGVIFSELEQIDKALLDYNKAIELDQNNSQAYYNRARIYMDLQKYEKAIDDLNQAMYSAFNLLKIYLRRSSVYDILNNHEQVISDCTQAIQIDPDNIEAYIRRGANYLNLDQHEKSLADFSRVLQLQPDNSEAYFFIGLNHFNCDDLQKALTYFKKAAELGHPQGEDAMIWVKQKEQGEPITIEPPNKKSQKKLVQKESNKSKKIGRNDPCPCGSGLKYKKCCLNKQG